MMLEIALEADEEWDSSRSWERLARRAAEAAIAESAYPELAESERPVEISVTLTSNEQVRALNAKWRGQAQPDKAPPIPHAGQAEFKHSKQSGEKNLVGADNVPA